MGTGSRETANGVVQTSSGVVQTTDATGGVTIVDSFEDQNITEYSGDTGQASVVGSQTVSPVDGSYSLEIQMGSSDTVYSIQSTSGLNAYPSKADEFNAYVRASSIPSNLLLTFRFGDLTNGNYFSTWLEDAELQLTLYSGGSASSWSTASMTVNAGTWYRFNFQWDDGATFGGSDGDVTVEAFDTDTGSAVAGPLTETDSSITAGEIEFYSQGRNSIQTFYEYVHIV